MKNNISKDYVEQLKVLHDGKTFGTAARLPEDFVKIVEEKGVKSILDFGCGKGNTTIAMQEKWPDMKIYSYDPVTAPIDLPEQVDMVYSSDVLEHVEPNEIDETLDNLFSISNHQYHYIACHLAKKTLTDGRNAHLIVEPSAWWEEKMNNNLGDSWQMTHSETKTKVGKTKKPFMGSTTVVQEKYLVILERVK